MNSPSLSEPPSTILVVDDTPDNIRLLTAILSNQGYEVRKALNGKMALRAVSISCPDLILLDINMPDIDGYQVCEQLKQDPQFRDVPIIFISASDEVSDKIRAFALGAVDYVTKPFEQGEVISRVTNQLRLRSLQIELEKKNKSLELAMQRVQQTQTELVQQQKMVALGQLVAGIAHEINNPVTFIYGNITYIKSYTQDMMRLVRLYRKSVTPSPEIIDLEEEVDLEFLSKDLSKLLESVQVGAERIREIVFSLRNFSRLGESEYKAADIHSGLNSTLMLLEYRLKGSVERSGIKIVRNYGELPLIDCHAGKINQVWMNILNNAIEALEAKYSTENLSNSNPDSFPSITINTKLTELGQACITIIDNGCGMEESVQQRIFEPFFSAKKFEQAKGLGMTISYGIIVNEHSGDISYTSQPEVGTTVQVFLPQKVLEPKLLPP